MSRSEPEGLGSKRTVERAMAKCEYCRQKKVKVRVGKFILEEDVMLIIAVQASQSRLGQRREMRVMQERRSGLRAQ